MIIGIILEKNTKSQKNRIIPPILVKIACHEIMQHPVCPSQAQVHPTRKNLPIRSPSNKHLKTHRRTLTHMYTLTHERSIAWLHMNNCIQHLRDLHVVYDSRVFISTMFVLLSCTELVAEATKHGLEISDDIMSIQALSEALQKLKVKKNGKGSPVFLFSFSTSMQRSKPTRAHWIFPLSLRCLFTSGKIPQQTQNSIDCFSSRGWRYSNLALNHSKYHYPSSATFHNTAVPVRVNMYRTSRYGPRISGSRSSRYGVNNKRNSAICAKESEVNRNSIHGCPKVHLAHHNVSTFVPMQLRSPILQYSIVPPHRLLPLAREGAWCCCSSFSEALARAWETCVTEQVTRAKLCVETISGLFQPCCSAMLSCT